MTCFLLTGLSACCTKKEYCGSERIKVALVGFNRTESRLLLLKRNKQWNNDKTLDSAQLTYAGDQPYNPNKPDTLWLSEYRTNGIIRDIYHGNDWHLSIQGTDKAYLFTDIIQSNHISEIISCTDNKTSCENPVISFKVNGNVSEGNTVYLIKTIK